MNVFISWSGSRSRAVAEILRDWIQKVLQGTRPWLSTRDIEGGALWISEINEQLKESSIGIICISMDNRSNPWILFEAGALAKGLPSNRVCTFLVDLLLQKIPHVLQLRITFTPDETYRSCETTEGDQPAVERRFVVNRSSDDGFAPSLPLAMSGK